MHKCIKPDAACWRHVTTNICTIDGQHHEQLFSQKPLREASYLWQYCLEDVEKEEQTVKSLVTGHEKICRYAVQLEEEEESFFKKRGRLLG